MTEADPYKLLRVLEDVTDKHARTVKRLNRVLNRLRKSPDNLDLQSLAATYLRRLRVLRARLLRALGDSVSLDEVEEEVKFNIATLSEYMVIVGSVYEDELLRKALYLARRGATLLAEDKDLLESDREALKQLTGKLQEIIDKYY